MEKRGCPIILDVQRHSDYGVRVKVRVTCIIIVVGKSSRKYYVNEEIHLMYYVDICG